MLLKQFTLLQNDSFSYFRAPSQLHVLPGPNKHTLAFAARLFPHLWSTYHLFLPTRPARLALPSPLTSPPPRQSRSTGPGKLHTPFTQVRALLFVFPFPYSPLAFPSPLTCPPGFLGSHFRRPSWSSCPTLLSPRLLLPRPLVTLLSPALPTFLMVAPPPAPHSMTLLSSMSCTPLGPPSSRLAHAGPLLLRTSRVANPRRAQAGQL
jgi:hypothetical protein